MGMKVSRMRRRRCTMCTPSTRRSETASSPARQTLRSLHCVTTSRVRSSRVLARIHEGPLDAFGD